ncbi:TMEM175 family protein [Schumannella soli]|uniref:DUF1211 domain-containing protein n=1 Tax=Schumannella soli TaxID=2590779 RepID=A0A506Y1D1_9MICO|nr:TMEM175 family protein [Schumannella soli]TPW75693.1 DUF1211 domain-containing protein [Schumannella soli]
MSDVRDRSARLFQAGEGTDRIQFFSDAVFAIALTLLVLDIRLPTDLGEHPGAGRVASALVELWPQFFGYLLSFVVIAINWVNHHRKFRVIGRWDSGLLIANFALLALVAFLPFPTSALAEYGAVTPVVVLYAATVAALNLAQLWLWVHARRRGLMSHSVDEGVYRFVIANLLAMPVIFGLSIAIAFVSASWAMYFWILTAPASALVVGMARRRYSPLRAAARPSSVTPDASAPGASASNESPADES